MTSRPWGKAGGEWLNNLLQGGWQSHMIQNMRDVINRRPFHDNSVPWVTLTPPPFCAYWLKTSNCLLSPRIFFSGFAKHLSHDTFNSCFKTALQ